MKTYKEARIIYEGVMTAIQGDDLSMRIDDGTGGILIYNEDGDDYSIVSILPSKAGVILSEEITMTEAQFGKPPYILTKG